MNDLLKDCDSIIPLVAGWAEEQEQRILDDGSPLSRELIDDARRIPVLSPEKVRLLKVDSIPIPQNPILKKAAEKTNLLTINPAGLTLRYGIFIRSDHWEDRNVIVHELVHTSQYERLNGFNNFLRIYLHECITIGYPGAPMEQEAGRIQREICQQNMD